MSTQTDVVHGGPIQPLLHSRVSEPPPPPPPHSGNVPGIYPVMKQVSTLFVALTRGNYLPILGSVVICTVMVKANGECPTVLVLDTSTTQLRRRHHPDT